LAHEVEPWLVQLLSLRRVVLVAASPSPVVPMLSQHKVVVRLSRVPRRLVSPHARQAEL